VELCEDVDVPDDDEISGAVEPPELVHAEMVVETRSVKVTQVTAVSLALAVVPGVWRTFMKPPYMPGGRPYR
jgi:hypothetical protein